MHSHIAGAHRKATLVIVWLSQYRVAILGDSHVLCLALQFTVATDIRGESNRKGAESNLGQKRV